MWHHTENRDQATTMVVGYPGTTAHPLYTIFTNIFGASISEATVPQVTTELEEAGRSKFEWMVTVCRKFVELSGLPV